jgi:molybdopterin-guanine dinucleotide biosynthesis protein A
MGRDKALIEVDGVALARRVADALRAGGCDEVLAIGGDAPALAALGLTPIADRWPGEGPLGGLATALGAVTPGDVVVLAPCDLLDPSSSVVARLVAAVADVEAVAVSVGERVQWLPSAWRVSTGLAERVAALVDAGSRRLDAVADVVADQVISLEPDQVADADTPADLP